MLAYLSTASSAGQFITVLLIFIFVLAVTLFTTRFVGNFQKEKSKGSNITVVETERISQNKYIQLVKIADRYFAIAVCKDTVTNLGEIPADSLVFPDETAAKPSFREFLSKAREEEKKD